jgi:hypothetical protein
MRVVAIHNRRYPPARDALELADEVVASVSQLSPELISG